MADKKILSLDGQKHLYVKLATLFETLSPEDITSILNSLGLDAVLDENGDLIPAYTLSISSNKPNYIVDNFDIKLTAKMYNYFQDVSDLVTTWKWERDSGNTTEDIAWARNKTTKVLNLTREDFTDRFNSRDVIFKLTGTIKGKEVTDTIEFSRFQTFSKVQIEASATAFVEVSPTSIKFNYNTNIEVQQVRWFLDDNFKSSSKEYVLAYTEVPLKGAATVKIEVTEKGSNKVYTDTITIPRVGNGSDGEDGVGVPGTTFYTWIKYAEGPNGEFMNEYPFKPDGTAREYIGMAYNKLTPKESDNPADYIWSKYIGEDGIPGENGYVWLKYSIWDKGRDPSGDVDMYDTPFIIKPNGEREDMVYLGIAYNKQEKLESWIPEDYAWSKIKGEDGRTPFTLDLSNDNVTIPVSSSGTPGSTSFDLAKTDIVLYYGNDIVSQEEYTLQLTPINVTINTSNNNHSIKVVSMVADAGEVKITAFPKDNPVAPALATATFSITRVKGTAIYEIIPSVSTIKVVNNIGSSQTTVPTSVNVKVMKNTGDSVVQTLEGTLSYRYIYTSTVGTEDDGDEAHLVESGTIINVNNAGDPLFLELNYFHPTTGYKVDKETIPFVRDGVAGNSQEMRFRRTKTDSIYPSLEKTNPNPPGWTIDMPAASDNAKVLWMTKATKTGTGTLIGEWTDPVIFMGLPGQDGQDGPPGISGTTGPSPRTFEWVPGKPYQYGGGFIDYAYYRGNTVNVNDPARGWYTVKIPAGHTKDEYNETPHIEIANSAGSPDTSRFDKAPFSDVMTFSTIIAEQANLAGFVFRNQVLTSQASGYQTCTTTNDRGPFPNLTLDGQNGIIKFLERLVLDSSGITMKDDCGRPRMLFKWDNGAPMLEFRDETGKVTWKAGQGGYIYIGTTEASWSSVFAQLTSIPIGSTPSVSDIPITSFRDKVCTSCNGYEYFGFGSGHIEDIVGYEYIDSQPPTSPENNHKIFTSKSLSASKIQDGWYITYYSFYSGYFNSPDTSRNIVSCTFTKYINGLEVESKIVERSIAGMSIWPCGSHGTPSCI